MVAVHSWVVIKGENEKAWRRYDVAGWGNPVRLNWLAAGFLMVSARTGTVVADIKGPKGASP